MAAKSKKQKFKKSKAWPKLVRVTRGLVEGVEADLKAAGFPTLGWYDVLLELDRAGPGGLRPFELQDQLLLAQYNLSRLIDRMVRDGLVERRPCPEDRRGQVLHATEKGLALRQAMWPVYRAAIATHFSGNLARGEAEALAGLLDKLASGASNARQ